MKICQPYSTEVLGRNVEIYFVDNENEISGKYYQGIVVDMRKRRDKNGSYNEHLVSFMDGDIIWFDLKEREEINELRWTISNEEKQRTVEEEGIPKTPELISSLSKPDCIASSIQSSEETVHKDKKPKIEDKTTVKVKPEQDLSRNNGADDAAIPDIDKKDEKFKIEDGVVKIKTEGDLLRKTAKKTRIYGDRVLLARQSPVGMMKLGGGNTSMVLYPSSNVKENDNHPRFDSVIGAEMAIAYNDAWNPDGPKYAGQEAAAVSVLPYRDGMYCIHEVFHIFMKRCHKNHVLGWEYCGKYKYVGDEEMKMYASAHGKKMNDRDFILSDMKRSLTKPNGSWHNSVQYWIRKLDRALMVDNSPAGPAYLIEKRKPTAEEAKEPCPSLAARARALGYKPNLSKCEVAEVLVWLNEFFSLKPIAFVEYDEVMYNHVKEGESTRSSVDFRRGKQPGELCVRASDFYALHDQTI